MMRQVSVVLEMSCGNGRIWAVMDGLRSAHRYRFCHERGVGELRFFLEFIVVAELILVEAVGIRICGVEVVRVIFGWAVWITFGLICGKLGVAQQDGLRIRVVDRRCNRVALGGVLSRERRCSLRVNRRGRFRLLGLVGLGG